MLKTIDWQKKFSRTQKLLDFYRGLLKSKIETTRIDDGGLVVVRIHDSMGHVELEEIRKELVKYAGHENFLVVVCKDKMQLYSIMREKLNWILGSDIKRKWLKLKKLSAEKRVEEFDAFLSKRGTE